METWHHREAEPLKTQAETGPLWHQQQHFFWHMETWHHREAESSSLFSNSWPRQGRLPERECNRQGGQVLQLILAALCLGRADLALFIGNLTNHIWFLIVVPDWRTRCLDNGYNSEPDWYKLCVDVSGLVCLVILVYQSRLSVSSAGRIRFWRSSQFLVSGFP